VPAVKAPKISQVWRCPECGNGYRATIPVRYALCNKTDSHKSRTNKAMELIEGSELNCWDPRRKR